MEAFTEGNAIKLRSHLDRYLIAGDDRQTVRQSRNGFSSKAIWTVESIQYKLDVIRLKSCHGKYLTATDVPVLLGTTGKKVLQTMPEILLSDFSIEWEVIRDGFQVKIKSCCGKFLLGNGGAPPWRNKVTHDDPHSTSARNWVLWDVEVVTLPEPRSFEEYLSNISSLSSVSGDVLDAAVYDDDDLESMESPRSVMSVRSPRFATRSSKLQRSNSIYKFRRQMDFFQMAKAVRLRSHHDKYLLADDDEVSVTQDRNGSSKNAKWTVEIVPGSTYVIRLKSCYGKYLTASNQPFLLGMTGRKVLQTLPRRLDSSVEWEPVREGSVVKLKTRYGHFLRANGGLPPWRNSITHDIPHRTSTQEWIFWVVDIVEILVGSPGAQPQTKPHAPEIQHSDSLDFESGSPTSASTIPSRFSRQESSDSYMGSPPKSGGRTIYYHVTDESGDVDDEGTEGYALSFKGNGVDELTQKLKEELSVGDIVVCTRSPLNGKLCPLRLQLPPNNADMHVVVVPSSSIVA